MKLFTPECWTDYELIDSGGLEKLERFGKFILARPEPQAVWSKSLQGEEWEKMFHARYKRTRGIDPAKRENSEKGEWIRKKTMPDRWKIGYSYREMQLQFRLGLTSFGHIGVFPEQAVNWNYIYDFLSQSSKFKVQNHNSNLKSDNPSTRTLATSPPHYLTSSPAKVLNLFAYTGGASLAARAAGADVVHVDSVKPVVTWAREMMEASGLNDIRWVVEDALKFVQREVKRGNRYDGIILDPPAYGRGPEGEKWILQDSIDEMIALCHQLLNPEHSFFVLSLYSMGFSSLISESLVRSHFGELPEIETGELYFADRANRKLPLGTVLRFTR
ncbi:MAG: class I SAM-dependent methyltransferase [Bacteroidales bacterium]|jgi:23S rRNA (cytosine1962-C5)-methyltransferase|nr:class I SAM-dependent methyltransferase [Bacteroidales bacterium]